MISMRTIFVVLTVLLLLMVVLLTALCLKEMRAARRTEARLRGLDKAVVPEWCTHVELKHLDKLDLPALLEIKGTFFGDVHWVQSQPATEATNHDFQRHNKGQSR